MASIFVLKVVPSAGKQLCVLDKRDMITCYLKSPAQDNKANVELIKFLAHMLDCPQREILILRGATARTKTIKLTFTISREDFLKKLGIESQETFLF